ncbi:MAG: hypothetical protein ACHQ53_05085 [Polyangiales bacterium]
MKEKQMHKQSFARVTMLAACCASALGLSSCQTDLGKCDLTMLGGSTVPGMLAPYAGQVVVQTNCASGHCHTVTATGINRSGVPAGLNFDVVPNDTSQPELDKITRGIKVAADHRQAMWGEVESGYMPPKGGPALSAADKETLRNWLACGPNAIAAPGGATGNDWGSIYATLGKTCTVCHGTTTAMVSGNGFLLGDPDTTNPVNVCAAYHNILNKKSVTTMGMPVNCASTNMALIVPGQPDMSLLLKKIEGTQPCGAGMPLGAPLGPNNATTIAVRQWITAGAPPPAGCQ